MKIKENEQKLRASNITEHGAVFVLGAGFSKAIGSCAVNGKSFDSPLDKDFFKVLKEQGILASMVSGGMRLVTHHDVDDEDVERAIAVFTKLLK